MYVHLAEFDAVPYAQACDGAHLDLHASDRSQVASLALTVSIWEALTVSIREALTDVDAYEVACNGASLDLAPHASCRACMTLCQTMHDSTHSLCLMTIHNCFLPVYKHNGMHTNTLLDCIS